MCDKLECDSFLDEVPYPFYATVYSDMFQAALNKAAIYLVFII
jgi:hypothetical protein